jgi:hypothetical protein
MRSMRTKEMAVMPAEVFAGEHAERIPAGAVLVADTLFGPGRADVACPASVLLDGELRRRGLATARGPLSVDGTDVEHRPPIAFAVTYSAIIPVACGGRAGLGAAADIDDRAGRRAAGTAVADWLSAARSRIVLLAAPRSFCAGVERAVEVVAGATPADLGRAAAGPRSPADPGPSPAELAAGADLVLVLGEPGSTAVGLVELVRREGTPAQLIHDAAGIRPRWLAEADVVGLTAGASVDPALVDQVLEALAGLGPLQVTERISAHETTHFAFPPPA